MNDLIEKLYIEPTSHCNLSCPMCSRNQWIDEKIGHMDYAIFEKAIREAAQIDSIHTIFFGGIGEPLSHPQIMDMIKAAKETGKNTELITNGTMLDDELIGEIIGSGIHRIWISADSVDDRQYASIRSGADFQSLNDNLYHLKMLRKEKKSKLKVGISFVLMKKNADKLPALPSFAEKYDISDIKVTNLIPNSPEMTGQILYERSLSLQLGEHVYDVNIDVPMFDLKEETIRPFYELYRSYANFYSMGQKTERKAGYCRFVHESNVFIRWDGEVCPCMALLHTAKTYLYDFERTVKCASFGNMKNDSLIGIWHSKDYTAFRERVRKFEFSPCTVCGGCDYRDSNEEDCFGNPFPVCGACLWAQGFVQCP